MLYQYIIQIENYTQYLYLSTLHNTTKLVVIFTEIKSSIKKSEKKLLLSRTTTLEKQEKRRNQ